MQQSLSDGKAAETLSGTVVRIVFHSEQSGFSVLRLQVKGSRDPVTVTGYAASLSPGEFVSCNGEWHNDKSYGMQFRAGEISVTPPATIEGIEKYLASGMVRGVGQHFAKVLVEAFGDKVFSVIENAPDKLGSLPGIGEKRSRMIIDAWHEQKAVRDIMVFLQSHSVGTARAVRIYKTYGDKAIEVVRSDPYRLVLDIPGIGFKTADTIASSLGTAQDSPMRARAGVRFVLQEIAGEGHCASTRQRLVDESSELLGIGRENIELALSEEIIHGRLVADDIDGVPCIYLAQLYRAENSVSSSVKRIVAGRLPWEGLDVKEAVRIAEEQTGLVFSASQKNALRASLQSKLLVITGGPGVGKTTLVNAILKVTGSRKLKITLCAPTGRAAKRLSESTGLGAKTIHRLLEFDPQAYDFRKNRDNPLNTELIIVDETSMIDVVLMAKLLAAVPDNAAVMFVGDVDQLPPVGPGAVLDDIIASGTVPVVFLTEVFRQASESRIVINAHRINRGEMPLAHEENMLDDFYFVPASDEDDIRSKLLEIVLKRIPYRFGFDPLKDIQVLTPMNRGGLGTKSLNIALQKELNPDSRKGISRFGTDFAPGDKVIQLVNNYDKDVFNGDIGVIQSVSQEDSLVVVLFDGREVEYESGELDELSLAYATSIHKSQGSEYPAVVIPLTMQHYIMLQRNLLYTAVTRGKQLVMIIGQKKALNRAVAHSVAGNRLTNLAFKLQ